MADRSAIFPKFENFSLYQLGKRVNPSCTLFFIEIFLIFFAGEYPAISLKDRNHYKLILSIKFENNDTSKVCQAFFNDDDTRKFSFDFLIISPVRDSAVWALINQRPLNIQSALKPCFYIRIRAHSEWPENRYCQHNLKIIQAGFFRKQDRA